MRGGLAVALVAVTTSVGIGCDGKPVAVSGSGSGSGSGFGNGSGSGSGSGFGSGSGSGFGSGSGSGSGSDIDPHAGSAWRVDPGPTAKMDAPHAPDPAIQPLGLVWQTDPTTWRTPSVPDAAAFGPSFVVVSFGSTLFRYDLATGRTTLTESDSKRRLHQLVPLDATHWLGVGDRDKTHGVFVFDPATFVGTFTPLHAAVPVTSPNTVFSAVRFPDGKLAIAGPDLPLAIYDPATWIGRIIAPTTQVDRLALIDGSDLIGSRHEDSTRWDRPESREPIAYPIFGVDRVVTGTTQRVAAKNSIGMTSTLVMPRASPAFFATDFVKKLEVTPDGARVLQLDVSSDHLFLTITRVADGKQTARVDLGPDDGMLPPGLTADATRVLVSQSTMLHVVDLATGKASARTVPPTGDVSAVSVANDGSVLVAALEATRFVDGKLDFASPVIRFAEPSLIPGDTTHYLAATGADSSLVHYAISGQTSDAGSGDPQRVPADGLQTIWLGTTGKVLATSPHGLVRDNDGELAAVRELHDDDVSILAADPDADVVLVERGAEAHAYTLGTNALGPALRVPSCGDGATGALQPGGTLVALAWSGDVALWDRATGVAGATLAIAGDEAVYSMWFVPGHDELLVVGSKHAVLWSVAAKEVRAILLGSPPLAAVSPDGTRVAVAFADNRVALFDLDQIRAAPPLPAPVVDPDELKPTCPGGELFKPAP